MPDLNQLLSEIEQAENSASIRKKWNPAYGGKVDIRISVDGTWYHEGRVFQRESLVKLFAGVLRKEQGNYFLVTPNEKLSIQVDDAPFVAAVLEFVDQGEFTALVFTTNLGERVVADGRHPIRVEIDDNTLEPRPYIYVRDGLEALISRNVFFELVNMASEYKRNGKMVLAINSMGTEFVLGHAE